jgi:hypothetical protein
MLSANVPAIGEVPNFGTELFSVKDKISCEK